MKTNFATCRCETCGKGFLRRERYVTHVRIHTGEKPFVCAVCSRGYRDRRELKKHQTTHNHSGQSAPIPGSGPVTIPPPNAAQTAAAAAASNAANAAAAAASGNTNHLQQGQVTKTIVVQQQPQQVPQSPQPHNNLNVTSNSTVHLPSTPVPKELLNINGQTQVVSQRIVQAEPLNPANIPLPPSVASALQSINDRVTKQQRQKQIEEQVVVHQQHQQQQVQVQQQQQQQQHQQQIIKTEPQNQIITLQGSPTGGSGSSGNGPLFYYLMPGSVPYSLTGDGGATVQVKTSDGSIATAQLVTVPSGAIQSIVQQSGSSPTVTTNSTKGQQVVMQGDNNTSWILETSPSPSAVSRNSM